MRRTLAQRRKLKKTRTVGLQDAMTAVLWLSAAGTAQLGSEPLMAAVPRGMKDAVWMIFGSLLASFMYVLLRLTNYPRAMAVNRALSRFLLGDQPSNSRLGSSSVPALVVAAALGGLSGFQSLPGSAG